MPIHASALAVSAFLPGRFRFGGPLLCGSGAVRAMMIATIALMAEAAMATSVVRV